MAVGDNPVIPLFEEGHRPTGAAAAAIVAGKFIKIGADLQASPILNVATPLVGGNLMQVVQCVGGDRCIGVSGWDAPTIGDVVPIIALPLIVPMVAGAAITFGQEVQSDAAGNPITLAAGRSNGIALNSAAGGATVWVALR
jgi:hypothetical protein